jgi:hypothetical protein
MAGTGDSITRAFDVAVCALFANCLWDGYADFSFTFTLSDVSPIDYFHPNINGQNGAATISWNASCWASGTPARHLHRRPATRTASRRVGG